MFRQSTSTKPALVDESIDLVRDPRQEGATSVREREFDCGWEGCLKSFNSKNDLKRHNMIHTGEKPFKCPILGCRRAFCQRSRIREHVDCCHDKNKAKPCSLCAEWFGSSKARNTHMKQVHGNMQECIECGRNRCISVKCTRRAHCHDPTHPVPPLTAKASLSKAGKETRYAPYSTERRGSTRSTTPASITLAAAGFGPAVLQMAQTAGMMALPIVPPVCDVYHTIWGPLKTPRGRFSSPASLSSAASHATGPSSSDVSSSSSSYSSSPTSLYSSLSPTFSSTSDLSCDSPWTHLSPLNPLQGIHHADTERRRTAPPKDKFRRHNPYSMEGRSKTRRPHADESFSSAIFSPSATSYDSAPSSSAASSSSSASPTPSSFSPLSSTSELPSPELSCSPLSPLISRTWHNIERTGLDLPVPFASPSSPASTSLLSFAQQPPPSPSSSSSSFGSSTSATSSLITSEPSSPQSPCLSPSSSCTSPDELSTSIQKMLAEALDAGLALDPPPAPPKNAGYIADMPYAITHPAYIGFCTPKLPEDVHWSLAHSAVVTDLGAIGQLDLQVLLGGGAEVNIDLEDVGLGIKVSENAGYWDVPWGEHEQMDVDVDERMPGSWH